MADSEGVLGGLQDRCERLPFVVAEIRVTRTGSHYQIIIRNTLAELIQTDAARLTINTLDTVEPNLGIALMAQNLADRHSNVGERQRRSRHLIQQRLKQMKVALVYYGNLGARSAQSFGTTPVWFPRRSVVARCS